MECEARIWCSETFLIHRQLKVGDRLTHLSRNHIALARLFL